MPDAGSIGPVGAPRSGGAPTVTAPAAGANRTTAIGRRGRILAAGGAALSLAAGFGYLVTGRGSTGEPPLPIPIPGSRSLPVPLFVVAGLDESGSTSTSDPNRASHQATLIVAEWLAQHSGDARDRIGVVRFAETAETIAPLPAARASQELAQALGAAANIGGGTRLGPAVEALCRMLAPVDVDRKVVFLVTDGAVSEPDDEVRALIGRLRACADAVYIVALDHDGSWSGSTRTRYLNLGLTGEIVVGRNSSGELAAVIANALVSEAGLATK